MKWCWNNSIILHSMFCGGSSFIQGVLKECSFVLYEMNFFKMDMGDSKRLLQVQAFIILLFIEVQRLFFWIYKIQRYTISNIWLDTTKTAFYYELITVNFFGRFLENTNICCNFLQKFGFRLKNSKINTLFLWTLITKGNKNINQSKIFHFGSFYQKSRFLSNFGVF